MGADQIAEIQPAIREAIDGGPNACVTLEVDGLPERWIQIVGETINAAYPFEADPNEKLKALPPVAGMAVSGWEPLKFATVQVPSLADKALPRWIDAYFVSVLGCPLDDYHLNIASEDL